MANILNQITVGNKLILEVDAAPNTSSGTAANAGWLAQVNNATSGKGELWVNLDGTATGWDKLASTSQGNVASGAYLNIPIYNTSATGYTVADVVQQNSQNIHLGIATQATRSAALQYTLPNPGDAIASTNILLDQGAATVQGAWTFSSPTIFNGNVTMNGSLTYIHSTNTTISDPLITLNKGGAASSAAGVGFEIEENAIITGYLKTSSTRDGYDFLAPSNANVMTIKMAGLSATRVYTAPDAAGTLLLQPTSAAGVAQQIPYWTSAYSITAPTGVGALAHTWDAVNGRLGIGNTAPSVALHVSGSARIDTLTTAGFIINDTSGNLSSKPAIVLTSDVSGVLPVANGGTNSATALASNRIMVSSAGKIVEAAALTNGQLLIGSSSAAPVAATLTGTASQVIVTNGAGSITLSLPQSIATSSSPTFVGATLSGLSTAGVVHNSAAGVLSTSLVSLTADVSGILPLINGGTGVAAASANAAFNALSPMTALGDVIYGAASGAATRLAGNTTAVKQFFTQTGTGTVSAAPAWAAIVAGDLPTITLTGNVTGAASGGSIATTIAPLAVVNSMIAAGTIDLTAKVTGILPVANGGTNSSTALNSNRIMVSASGAIVEAAALANGQLLIGSAGAAPVAAAIAVGAFGSLSVVNGAGSITIDAIQDIRTSASPSFSGLNVASTTATTANYRVQQAQVSTTTATATTLATIATASDQVMLLEVRCVGRRTGGTAGATDDCAAYIRTVKVKNAGGTVTVNTVQATYTQEDQTAWDCQISASGTNVLVQVVGAANNNINWAATYITQTL